MIAVLKSLSTRGDVGTGCLAYAIGALVDVFYFPGGLEPSKVAAFSAIGALGVKKLLEPLVTSAVRDWLLRRQLFRQATALLDDTRTPDLERMFGLWRSGAIEDNHLRDAIRMKQEALVPMKVTSTTSSGGSPQIADGERG